MIGGGGYARGMRNLFWDKCYMQRTRYVRGFIYIYLYSVEKEEENLSLSLFLRISFQRKEMILVM